MNLTGWEDEPDNMEQRTKEINLFDLNHYLAFNISYVMGKAQSFLFHSLSPVHVYAQFLHLSVALLFSLNVFSVFISAKTRAIGTILKDNCHRHCTNM